MSVRKVEFETGVWNRSDQVALGGLFAVAATIASLGILGVLGHEVIPSLPFPVSAFMSGIGGVLFLSGIGGLIYKGIKSSSLRYKHIKQIDSASKSPQLIEDKKYSLDSLDGLFRIVTATTVFMYCSEEPFVEKIEALEKEGYQAREAIVNPPPSQKVSLDAKKLGNGCLWIGTAMTLLSIPAFIVPFFYPFAYCWTMQTVALGVIISVFYGQINDQFATRQSLTYFTLGHTEGHRRLIASDSPTANACAWGIFTTWWVGLIGGALLAIAATITQSYAINPLFLAPVTILGTLCILAYTHTKSKQLHHALQHPYLKRNLINYYNNPENDLGKDHDADAFFETVYLRNVPEDERPGWEAVGRRNSFGYSLTALFILSLLVAIIATRIFLAVQTNIIP